MNVHEATAFENFAGAGEIDSGRNSRLNETESTVGEARITHIRGKGRTWLAEDDSSLRTRWS